MPSGIEVNYTGRGTNFIPILPMTLRMVVQRYPRVIVNSINDYNYNGMLFEADEWAHTKSGSNVYWKPNNTVWNISYPISFTPYSIPRVVGNVFMRPTVDSKSICITDVYKNYNNNTSTINFLTTPNTSISLIEVGTLNVDTIPSKYIEVKQYSQIFFDQTGITTFNQDCTKYAVVPILDSRGNVNTNWNGYSNDGSPQFNKHVNKMGGAYQYVDIPLEYDMSKVYVSTFGCYCNHINTDMLGVVVKYVGRRIYFKYYNRTTGNNATHTVNQFMPTVGSYQYQSRLFIGYFPNFL